MRSGRAGIQRSSDNCSCALAKGEPEEGGFPGRALRKTRAKHTLGSETVNRRAGGPFARQSIFALYQREALLRDTRSLREDSRSLREDSRSLCEWERSVVIPAFAESGSKNRLSQARQR